MSLQFDPFTGKITYHGREVGKHVFKDGKSTVRLTVEYETEGEWTVPLTWFAYGLSMLPENRPAPVLLEIQSAKDCIAQEFDASRYLPEKKIKGGGYIWKFHKTDADDWPSPLHGHDYDKHLKLDVLTGDIYDVGTRLRCKSLKAKDLERIRSHLRASKDFEESMTKHFPEVSSAARA
jgi:hypothetical protein